MSDCKFCDWKNPTDMAYENPSDGRIITEKLEYTNHLLEHLLRKLESRWPEHG